VKDFVAGALLLALMLTPAHANEAPVATISVSPAPSGSHLGRSLVEGVMTLRGREYLLTLRGVAAPTKTVGSVRGLRRPRDIEGVFEPADEELRNGSGVVIRFDPPLALRGRLEIELLNRRYPKASGGSRDGIE
jgi:hypothetical protein